MRTFRDKAAAILMLLFIHCTASAGLADHHGYWLGQLKIPDGPTLQSGIEIYARADGTTWASLSVIDQLQYDIPVTKIVETDDTAALELPFGLMRLRWHGDRFDAEWQQGGKKFPLELARVTHFERKSRPQEPKPPYPYQEQQIAIRGAEGAVLGATLSTPNARTRPDLVILVPGSGPQSRDVEAAGHRVFAVLADQLSRQGIAVLRYDKRGIGRSTGDYVNHTQAQLVGDVQALVKAMHQRHAFRRVGLIGHSEGSMIAAKVAAEPGAVDFIVSLAGPGLPGIPAIELQDRIAAKDRGADSADIQTMMGHVHRFYETIVAHADTTARIDALQALQGAMAPEDKAMLAKYGLNRGTLSMEMARQPFLRALLMTDVQQDWRRVRCPVLALNGSVDHQVPAENLDGIVEAVREGRNQKLSAAVLPSLNHLFQTASTGAESEYASIEQTFAPVAIERITTFIQRQR